MRGLALHLAVILTLVFLYPIPLGTGSAGAFEVYVSPGSFELFDDERVVLTVRVVRDAAPVAGALVSPLPATASKVDSRLVLTNDAGEAEFIYTPRVGAGFDESGEGFSIVSLMDATQVYFSPTVSPAENRVSTAATTAAPPEVAKWVPLVGGLSGFLGVAAAILAGRIRKQPTIGAFHRRGANPLRGSFLFATLAIMAVVVGIGTGDIVLVLAGVTLTAPAAACYAWSRRDARGFETRIAGALDARSGEIARALGAGVKAREVGNRFRVFTLEDATRVRVEDYFDDLRVRVTGPGAGDAAARIAPTLAASASSRAA